MTWEDWFWTVAFLIGLVKLTECVVRAYSYYSTENFVKHYGEIKEGMLLVQDNLWKLRSASVNIDGDDSTEKIAKVTSHLEQLLEWLDKCEVIQENLDLHWSAIGMRFTRNQVTMQINNNIAKLQQIYRILDRDQVT